MAGGTMVRELEPGSLVEATFAVTRKVRRTRRDGRAYLDIELADRSGRVRARVWEAVELLDGRFGAGDTVRVLGRVGSYEGKVELELRDVERLPDGDPLELVPGARRDVDDLDGYLDFLIAEIHDDALRSVAEAILNDAPYRARFRAAAATEAGHHAYAGGLIEHTVAVTALCRETAQWQPGLDTDVLTAAALLHDCGTPDALADGPVIRPSAEGLALGHVHTGLRRIEAAAARTRLPRERLLHLLACVAAHHGPPEGRRFPSAEAVALHAANALDARVAEARAADRGAERSERKS
jgi:3'-5' exoribonuclease